MCIIVLSFACFGFVMAGYAWHCNTPIHATWCLHVSYSVQRHSIHSFFCLVRTDIPSLVFLTSHTNHTILASTYCKRNQNAAPVGCFPAFDGMKPSSWVPAGRIFGFCHYIYIIYHLPFLHLYLAVRRQIPVSSKTFYNRPNDIFLCLYFEISIDLPNILSAMSSTSSWAVKSLFITSLNVKELLPCLLCRYSYSLNNRIENSCSGTSIHWLICQITFKSMASCGQIFTKHIYLKSLPLICASMICCDWFAPDHKKWM